MYLYSITKSQNKVNYTRSSLNHLSLEFHKINAICFNHHDGTFWRLTLLTFRIGSCIFQILEALTIPSQHLLVQSQQWKHQNSLWNLFKVNSKIRTTSFWCLYSELWTNFTHCSRVSIVDCNKFMPPVNIYNWKKKSAMDTSIETILIIRTLPGVPE